MKRFLIAALFSTMGGCVVSGLDRSETATNLLVPGIDNIPAVSVDLPPPHATFLVAQVQGRAHTLDGNSHSLAVILSGQQTKFFTIVDNSFSFDVNYTTDPDLDFPVQLSLGSDATNQVVVDSITLTVEE